MRHWHRRLDMLDDKDKDKDGQQGEEDVDRGEGANILLWLGLCGSAGRILLVLS